MTNQDNKLLFNTKAYTDILDEIRKYTRYWYWFLMALICTLILGYFYLRYSARTYLTQTKIQVFDKSKGMELDASAYLFNRPNINLENEVALLTSYPIIEEVVLKHSLNISFFEKGNIQTSELLKLPFNLVPLMNSDSIHTSKSFEITITSTGYDILEIESSNSVQIKGYKILVTDGNTTLPFEILEHTKSMNKLIGSVYLVKFTPKDEVIDKIKSEIKVKQVGDLSNILSLSLKGGNKAKSELILDALVEAYKQSGISDRKLVSKRTIEFVESRIVALFKELDSIEDIKKNFKQQGKFINIEQNALYSMQGLNASNISMLEITNQFFLIKTLKNILEQEPESPDLLPVNFGLNNATLNTLINEYNLNVLEFKKLTESAGFNNPVVIRIKGQLVKTKNNLVSSLEIYTKELEFKQSQIQGQNRKINTEVVSLPLKEKQLRSIERQQKIKENLYMLLLQKREETAINLSVTEPSIKVVEYARSNPYPIVPKPFVIYSIAVLFGILGPFGILYTIFALDTKIHDSSDLERLLPKIPIVAEIILNGQNKTQIDLGLNANTVQSEAFRILASNINLINPLKNNDSTKVVFLTSSIKGEGKTYASFNLALTLGSFNKKVLLIGGDLRNPQIHNYIAYDKNHKGLSNYLSSDDMHWEDSLIKEFEQNINSNIDILLSGPIPPNAPQLLSNGKLETLLNKAKKHYDYILIDTSPTILVTDTFLISKYANIVLYLIKSNYSDVRIAKHLRKVHNEKKLPNIALVLNGLKGNKSNSYNYGYGYGYQ